MAKLQIVALLLGSCGVLCTENVYEYKKLTLPGYDLREIERAYRGQEARVERPCPLYDLLCIRRYMARHSQCKIAEGPVPEPLYKTETNQYAPNSNLTITVNGLFFTGLTGTVSEFSVNKKSMLTVLNVDFQNVTIRDTKFYIRYHQRAQESEVTATQIGVVVFPSLSVTTVFKGVDHLRLEDSESVLFLNQLGFVVLGPGLANDRDLSIPLRFIGLMKQPLTFQLEALFTVAPFIAGSYIQNVLCDFGLNLD